MKATAMSVNKEAGRLRGDPTPCGVCVSWFTWRTMSSPFLLRAAEGLVAVGGEKMAPA